MTKVYDAFDRAFRSVSAYIVLRDGKPVARVALKHGNSIQAFVQVWGAEMARGSAGGGGYDRQSAAVEMAADKLRKVEAPRDPEQAAALSEIVAAIMDNARQGQRWTARIEAASEPGRYVVQHVLD